MTRILQAMFLSLLLLAGGCGSFEDFADEVDLDDILEDVQVDVDLDKDNFIGGGHGGSTQYEVGFARGESEGYQWGFGSGASASPYGELELFIPPGNVDWQDGFEDGFWIGYDEGYEDGFEEYLQYRP